MAEFTTKAEKDVKVIFMTELEEKKYTLVSFEEICKVFQFVFGNLIRITFGISCFFLKKFIFS